MHFPDPKLPTISAAGPKANWENAVRDIKAGIRVLEVFLHRCWSLQFVEVCELWIHSSSISCVSSGPSWWSSHNRSTSGTAWIWKCHFATLGSTCLFWNNLLPGCQKYYVGQRSDSLWQPPNKPYKMFKCKRLLKTAKVIRSKREVEKYNFCEATTKNTFRFAWHDVLYTSNHYQHTFIFFQASSLPSLHHRFSKGSLSFKFPWRHGIWSVMPGAGCHAVGLEYVGLCPWCDATCPAPGGDGCERKDSEGPQGRWHWR